MCLFCKIVNKEIPSSCIYEDDIVMAFLDISQVTKGHTLLIPKKHYATLLACEDEVLQHMMCIAKRLGNHLVECLDAKGMNILSNVNEVAGQTIPHFHLHLIPRYTTNDACSITFNESESQDLSALESLLKFPNNA